MKLTFKHNELQNFKNNIKREWAITNGIGGYAGGSILGGLNRTHQGYLIASLHPPVERYMVFSRSFETLMQNNQVFSNETIQRKGKNTEGQIYLLEFTYDGKVCFTYEMGDCTITKTIALEQGKNTVGVAYEVVNRGDAATLLITPSMNYKEHNTNTTKEDLNFAVATLSNGFSLIPDANKEVTITLTCSDATPKKRDNLYDVDVELQTEVDNEVDGLDTHYRPFDLEIAIPANSTKKISLVCSIEKEVTKDAFTICDEMDAFVSSLIKQADCKDDFDEELTVAANQFLAHRDSTGLCTVLAGLPWFTDWGRDTMIAYTGLTLSTGRFKEAHDILITFARYIEHGLVPNMFPDTGAAPLYNTVDASLWYFYAIDQYLRYMDTDEAYDFIKNEIYPGMKEIIAAYQAGTDFSIYMEEDSLIHAGSGFDQVTWMDVRVGEWVVTPRHGKPVEINALWYNALCVMEKLSAKFGEDSSDYTDLATKVKESFNEKFWNADLNCLYDVVSDEESDASIRPNQIYAVSLPYTMLDETKAKAVVSTVEKLLYAKKGLRSLSEDHKDYHGIYLGSLPKRDAAYHQGTAWGFLMGGFISAYCKVNGKSKMTAEAAMKFLEPVKIHLETENCIGSICEIFDGDAPHYGRGCYAQAWSIGEVLRCYKEDVQPYLCSNK